ncbi:MAG TPA: hypothetical protein VF862_00995 [Gemmatimonadales bacterium]
MSVPHIDQPAPPRRVWLLSIPVLVLGLWVLLRMYSSFGSDQCADGYAAAKTAADSSRVDSLVPDDGHGGKEKFSCGFRRTSARWNPR